MEDNLLSIAPKLRAALPAIQGWIDDLLASTQGKGLDPSHRYYLRDYFSQEVLDKTVFVVIERPPVPPLASLGLQELASLEHKRLAGITYPGRCFIAKGHEYSTILHCHELVHVVQWQHLGSERFLWTYGLGLSQHGYESSPLELTASRIEESYRHKKAGSGTFERIAREADAAWEAIAPFALSE